MDETSITKHAVTACLYKHSKTLQTWCSTALAAAKKQRSMPFPHVSSERQCTPKTGKFKTAFPFNYLVHLVLYMSQIIAKRSVKKLLSSVTQVHSWPQTNTNFPEYSSHSPLSKYKKFTVRTLTKQSNSHSGFSGDTITLQNIRD